MPADAAFIGMIGLMPAADLAEHFGYAAANNSFRDFCRKNGIKPIRPGWYDPHHVRDRLDAVQGITTQKGEPEAPLSLSGQRRKRIGKV